MKKLLLLLIFNLQLSTFNSAISQEWFPQGATWTYGYFSSLGPNYSEYPRYYQVGKDTVVLGKSCKQILGSINPSGPFISTPSFRYQDSGRVYYYEPPADTTWNLFYDFTKQVGDTIFYPQWEVIEWPTNDTVDYYVVVDSIFEVILINDTLKGYYGTIVQFCVGCGAFASFAIERVSGGEVSWYGGDVWDFGPLGLRCYEDSILGLYKSLWFSLDCDTTVSNVGLENELDPDLISIYPNPAKNSITIQSEIQNFDKLIFRVFDLNGAILKVIQFDSQNSNIDISHFKSGMYIYEIESQDRFLRDKLIIE